VRVWLSDDPPAVTWRPGYGPFTPYAAGANAGGAYDIHRNYISATNPGSVASPKFPIAGLVVEEPMGMAEGTPVYIWAAFAGVVPDTDPLPPGLGWEDPGTKLQGMNLALVTTGTLVLTPQWYNVVSATGPVRWETTSDMSGLNVTLVGITTSGWQNAAVATDRLQNNIHDTTSDYYDGGAILLGAMNATGAGDAYIGLGYNGMNSNRTGTDGLVLFGAGLEEPMIEAGTRPAGTPPRTGQTPEGNWIPEPASLLLIGLGALVLRRR
jgi:hypothetical protein